MLRSADIHPSLKMRTKFRSYEKLFSVERYCTGTSIPAKHAEFLESLDRQNKGHIPILRCSCSSSFRNSFQYW